MSWNISILLCLFAYFYVVLSLQESGQNVETYYVSRARRTTTSCGLLWWSTCTKYRRDYVKKFRCAPGYYSKDDIGCPFEDEKPVFTDCPTKNITTNDRTLNWTVTATDDYGQVTLKQVEGHPPGSLMDYGVHFIKYLATDASGNSASCAFTVEIKDTVKPGFTNCPTQKITTIDRKFNWTVTASDDSGHVTLKQVQGQPLGSLMDYGVHLIKYEATDASGNSASCAFTVEIKDTVKPVFTKCPTQKITTIDRKFNWTVTASDNSGQMTLQQVQGQPLGSLMEYGVHLIKYSATDAYGNLATCAFVIDIKATDCPRPTSKDTDVIFTCSGHTAQSYCQISCESGSSVEGSKYIACVRDKSENNTSYWEPVHGKMGTCSKRPCSPLNIPKNGALACDTQLGGTFCQIQCNHNYDIPFSEDRFHTFICWNTSDAWYPQSTVPDCLELSFPDEYYLPTDFYYYTGDCSDPRALNVIKRQFIDNLNSIGISPCMTDVCSLDDIKVNCGDTAEPIDCQFRQRRSSDQAKRVLHVRVKFHVKNTNRTLSPAAAEALLKYLGVKSKNLISTDTTIRTMISKALTPTARTMISKALTPTAGQSLVFLSNQDFSDTGKPAVDNPAVVEEIKAKSSAEKMSVKCKAGHTQTEAGACIPCSIGTYSDVKSHTCKSCPVTTYQDQPAMSSCKPCPSHHVALSPGAATRDQCLKQCGPDTFSLTGLIPCFPCPDGRYQPLNGSTTCEVSPESEVAGGVTENYLQK